jgi:hypothetical protein
VLVLLFVLVLVRLLLFSAPNPELNVFQFGDPPTAKHRIRKRATSKFALFSPDSLDDYGDPFDDVDDLYFGDDSQQDILEEIPDSVATLGSGGAPRVASERIATKKLDKVLSVLGKGRGPFIVGFDLLMNISYDDVTSCYYMTQF